MCRGQLRIIYEIPIQVSDSDDCYSSNEKTIRFTVKGNYSPGIGGCGFVGDRDELVVASYNQDLYMWSAPEGQQKKKEWVNDQPLFHCQRNLKFLKFLTADRTAHWLVLNIQMVSVSLLH